MDARYAMQYAFPLCMTKISMHIKATILDSRVRQMQRYKVENLIFYVLNLLFGKIHVMMDRTNWKSKGRKITFSQLGCDLMAVPFQ
jgi:aryl carrier-like protein